VERLWLFDDREESPRGERERVLPTGATHVVLRLDGPPLGIFDSVDSLRPREVAGAVVGGPRSTFYVRDVSRPSLSVGALLRPAAALAVIGAPAGALAGAHTPLADLWAGGVDRLRESLLECRTPAARLARFESFLASRLRPAGGPHPAVAHALRRFADGIRVGEVVEEVGLSHRRFLTLFQEAVGLTPKRFARLRRFQGALDRLAWSDQPLAELALDAGFSDQAHFAREFREIAGVTPSEVRALAPRHPHHLPIGDPGSISFKTRGGLPA
jgi:AraC-like DNA-binding protein